MSDNIESDNESMDDFEKELMAIQESMKPQYKKIIQEDILKNKDILKEELKLPTIITRKDKIKNVIPSNIWNKISQEFIKRKEGICTADIIEKYINRGSEINAELRKPENERIIDKKIIECLNKLAQPLKNLLKEYDKEYKDNYIILYRNMSKEYTEKDSQGFISTSNIPLRGFGQYGMKIFVPIDTKVLVANISKQTNIENSFEIILPKGTQLSLITEDNEYTYYVVLPVSDKVLEQIMNEIFE